ncbi:hypothetical protein C7N43_31805, partial [Sphingobacteriales bacterium UPWRP_1]
AGAFRCAARFVAHAGGYYNVKKCLKTCKVNVQPDTKPKKNRFCSGMPAGNCWFGSHLNIKHRNPQNFWCCILLFAFVQHFSGITCRCFLCSLKY